MSRLFARGDQAQLSLALSDAAPTTAVALREQLVRLGLDASCRLKLTHNRVTVASFSNGELRVHRGFLDAPPEIWRALVIFVHGRTRAARAEARRTIVAYPVADECAGALSRRSGERTHPDDERFIVPLEVAHADYNARLFGGALSAVSIRVSRRMRNRLGHYAKATRDGRGAEIAISRRHIRRDEWNEVLHTLLHEMVHQWQDETGRALDHGRHFRIKAREVGIAPAATRRVA